jgi:SOS-response transcriptional repressor LexA
MRSIHPYQKKLLEFLKKSNHHPTIREMMNFIGVKSTSTVNHHLRQLALKGYIDYIPKEITYETKEIKKKILLKVINPARYLILKKNKDG